MSPNATAIVRAALAGSGVELVASSGIDVYDAVAPVAFGSTTLMLGARGLIVVGSAGPTLWRRFRAHMDRDPECLREAHPLDRFVEGILTRADQALAADHVRFRRFEPTFHAPLRLDFVAMARLVGLGSEGPFGMLIHAEHGAWWALRGAWFVDAEVDPPLDHRPSCRGCAAPCIGGWPLHLTSPAARSDGSEPGRSQAIAQATPEARRRCVVGQQSRYDDEQVAYHYDRLATVARLKAR